MQAFYSDSIDISKTKLRRSNMSRNGGSFERSFKRSPYGDAPDPDNGESGKGGGSNNNLLFMLLTVILLLVLWPVGLVMLWMPRFRLSWPGKLLITLLTAVLFCFVLAFAANLPTKNETVKQVQNALNDGFDWVYSQTGGTIDDAGNFITQLYEDGSKKLVALWDDIDEAVAGKYLELYAYVQPNIDAVKCDIPALLGAKYLELTGYETPAPAQIEKQSDAGVKVAEPTATPSPTPAPVATPTPTPTPEPTPEPTPVVLPSIKDVALAPVYYTKNGTYYHLTRNCSGMAGADSHTLQEALNAGKKVCENCGVVSTDMLNYEGNYLWIDSKNVAHTTDECAEFPEGKYSVLPFEDVYQGHYTYCPVCHADICYEYMLQNDERYNVNFDDVDESTRLLYEYEKTITVYYGENSRKYHATQECQYMYDSKYEHTLYEALHVDLKDCCPLCGALTETQVQTQLDVITNPTVEPTVTPEQAEQ